MLRQGTKETRIRVNRYERKTREKKFDRSARSCIDDCCSRRIKLPIKFSNKTLDLTITIILKLQYLK